MFKRDGLQNKEVYLIYPALIDANYLGSPRKVYSLSRKPQLGLQYLAASLLKYNIESKIFDQSVDKFSFTEIANKIKKDSPLFVGIYSDSILKPQVLNLTKTLKIIIPEIKVVVGGPACVEYQEFHNNKVDIVCHGEGELTICDIADYFLGRKKIDIIKGISFLKDSKIIKNQEQALIDDLDTIPFPAREKIKINEYYDYYIFGMKRPYTTIIASRGCPYRCAYCSSHNFWKNKYRLRTPVNVINEIEMLVKEYRVKYIGFKDDIFGFNSDWVYEFVAEMKKRNLKISFSCMPHPFSFRNKRRTMLALLKEIGLDIIIPGLQSVDETVLKNINRDPEEPKYLAELIQEAKRLNISTVMEFILGLPGDSEEVFRKNFQFALKIRPHYALFYSLRKLPGSEIACDYGEKNVSVFSDVYIRKQAKAFQRRFFLTPEIIFQDMFHVLIKNPKWYLVAIKNLFYLFKSTGIT